MIVEKKNRTKHPGTGSAPVPSEAAAKVAVPSLLTAGNQPVKRAGNRGIISAKMKAHSFKPGQSGNPAGRPRTYPITDVLREMLHSLHPDQKAFPGMSYAETLALAMLNLAIDKGDMRAAVEIADRVEGRVPQGLQHTGPRGGALEFTEFSPEENERMIAELLAKAGYSLVASGERTGGDL